MGTASVAPDIGERSDSRPFWVREANNLNIVANVLYRALEKEQVKDLEVGIGQIPLSEKEEIKWQFELIDFLPWIRHVEVSKHFFLLEIGSRKYCFMYEPSQDSWSIHQPISGDPLPGPKISSIAWEFIDMVKKRIHFKSLADELQEWNNK